MGIDAIRSTTAVDISSLALSQSSSAAKSADKTETAPAQKGGGARPAGGGAVPAAASTSTSSSSSSAKIYNKRDTNKDGTVSYQEALLYALKNPTDETQVQPETAASQLQTGLRSYQQNQQANEPVSDSGLFSV